MCGAKTPAARPSRRPSQAVAAGLRSELEGIVVQHLTVARFAEGLGVARNTANDAVLAEGKRVLIDGEHRFDGVKVIAMDGFTGFKTATVEELPEAVAVMNPFHVVRLAGDALDQCWRRVQQVIHGHCGRSNDPFYRACRTLLTSAGLLTDKQKDRLRAAFTVQEHAEVEVTW